MIKFNTLSSPMKEVFYPAMLKNKQTFAAQALQAKRDGLVNIRIRAGIRADKKEIP